MLSLPLRSGSCCGAVAFSSLQHLPRATVSDLFGEFRRILTWDGVVILATHLGEGEVSVSDFLGHTVEPFGGTFYRFAELEAALASQSFVVEDVQYRDHLPHEFESKRVYLTARLTAG
jgi:hypothetical protein